MTTPRLGAPELTSGQATPETTVNEQIRYLESGAGHFIFKDRDLATPPGSPADGDCYLVDASGTGAWSGKDGQIAFRVNTAWAFITPIEGFTAWVNDENVFIGYDGSAWNTLASPSGSFQPLDADLTAIAALTGTNTIYYRSAANTWTAVTIGSNLTFSGGTLAASSVGSGGGLLGANNLSDVANASTSLANLGGKASAPSVQAVTSSATVTPTFTDDGVKITAQAAGLTLANPSGTAVSMWGWAIRIKDNGTARAISYGTQYRALGVTLPTTTVVSKTLYLGCVWNNDDSMVDVVAVAQEA